MNSSIPPCIVGIRCAEIFRSQTNSPDLGGNKYASLKQFALPPLMKSIICFECPIFTPPKVSSLRMLQKLEGPASQNPTLNRFIKNIEKVLMLLPLNVIKEWQSDGDRTIFEGIQYHKSGEGLAWDKSDSVMVRTGKLNDSSDNTDNAPSTCIIQAFYSKYVQTSKGSVTRTITKTEVLYKNNQSEGQDISIQLSNIQYSLTFKENGPIFKNSESLLYPLNSVSIKVNRGPFFNTNLLKVLGFKPNDSLE